MNNEQKYYEFERFWNDHEYSEKFNIEKINITFSYIQEDVKTLLDAGCGNGIFTNMVAEKFPNIKVVAFDRSETALKYVNTEKYVASIDNIPFKDNEFDCVVSHDVIEHLPIEVYNKALMEIARVAKKYIIIGVPNDENLKDFVSECPACKTIFNNHLHFRSFNQKKVSDLFISQGFECIEIKTCDKIQSYWGQKAYTKLFYPKWEKKFRSPICPVCGYINPDDLNPDVKSVADVSEGKSFLSMVKKIPRLIWPKKTIDYEMVALFKKKPIN